MMSVEMLDRLRNDFGYHRPPTPEDGDAISRVRDELLGAAMYIASNTPASREQSLALTKLEEAMHWAAAAIARQWPVA